jgi:plasmid stabilization system protein ParE
MMLWNIHPEAQRELEDAFDYHFLIEEELAYSFDAHYQRHHRQICENPLLYNLRRGVTRRVNLTPRFGEYYIAYMIWREKMVILAVAHAKRKPYYWRKRIAEAKEMF